MLKCQYNSFLSLEKTPDIFRYYLIALNLIFNNTIIQGEPLVRFKVQSIKASRKSICANKRT